MNRRCYLRSSSRTLSASASLQAVLSLAIRRSSSKSKIESAETPLLAESCRTVMRRCQRTLLRLCSSGMGGAYPSGVDLERPASWGGVKAGRREKESLGWCRPGPKRRRVPYRAVP